MKKSIEFFKKNIKLLLFILIFTIVCVIYNQNSQNLNYFLKRGTTLEYSLPSYTTIDNEALKKHLLSLGIKYTYINAQDIQEYEIYDFETKHIEKILYIGIPIIAKEDKTQLIDNISNYIFDNYQKAKLVNVKSKNNYFSKPYGSFIKFIELFIFSALIWFIVLSIIFTPKKAAGSIIDNIKQFFLDQKSNTQDFNNDIKGKNIIYILKKLLNDDKNADIEKTSLTKEIISLVVFVTVCIIIIKSLIGELRWIPSGSMRMTILEHDHVTVEKLHKKEIQRGDILVFYPPQTELKKTPWAIFSRLTGFFCKDMAFIKRTIGLPGEKLEVKYIPEIDEFRVYINDTPLNEPYVNSKTDWIPCREEMYCGPFIIPENSYFMMGDNRGNSEDSRFWGFLEKNRVIGRANLTFFPIKRVNLLRDKYLILHKEKENNEYKTYNYIVNRYEF